MPARGKLIVLEGIDGAGKRTQLRLLTRALAQQKLDCVELSFPRYEGFFGAMAGRYLHGEFGPLAAVDPHFSALLYAGDRLEARTIIEAALREGNVVLADRYVASNLAHQGARIAPEKRHEFLTWLRKLEYEIYELPAEDLVIYLRLAASEGHSRATRRASKDASRANDLHEANLAYMADAARMYDALALQPNWVTVACADADGKPADAEEIHHKVMAAMDARGLSLSVPASALEDTAPRVAASPDSPSPAPPAAARPREKG
jgi:dTMP kinase